MAGLDDRAVAVLMAIVREHIDTSSPVGSRTVARRCGLGLSPATIRNIMSDLEELGYLQHPHTSAGRLPTDKGYREYVDFCMEGDEGRSEGKVVVESLRGRLERIRRDATTLLEDITREVSALSRSVGIASAPGASVARLSRVELVGLKDTRVLAVVVTEEGIVRNMMVDLEEELGQSYLNEISGFFNRELKGATIEEARQRLVREVYEDKAVCDSIMSKVLAICEVFSTGTGQVFVGGRTEMLDHPEFMDLGKVREIYRAIEDKRRMLVLLDNLAQAGKVQVLIGAETHTEGIEQCSLVASPYRQGDRILGTVGVIGPTRMNYPEIMSIVEETANWLTRVFSEEG